MPPMPTLPISMPAMIAVDTSNKRVTGGSSVSMVVTGNCYCLKFVRQSLSSVVFITKACWWIAASSTYVTGTRYRWRRCLVSRADYNCLDYQATV